MSRAALLAALLAAGVSVLADAKPYPVTATAYSLSGRTFTGHRARPGCIAVDPKRIRLGSRLWVPGYGRGHACDTGRAIRGARIDVYIRSPTLARAWGRRRRLIRIQPPQGGDRHHGKAKAKRA